MIGSIAFAAKGEVSASGAGSADPDAKDVGQGTDGGSSQDASQGQPGVPSVTEGGQGTGQGQQITTEQQTQNEGESQQIQNKEQIKAQVNDLKQEMQQRKQQMDSEAQGAGGKKQEMLQNQNRVRLAAQSLIQMENMMGGVGKQVSEVAKGFDNSVQATIRAEEKIQTRSGFVRFFAGGDSKSAGELETEVNQNLERIRQLNQMRDGCDCDEEVKAMMQEQIQNMEQEQLRLQELAQNEKKSKGLLGWIWK
ncbi:MAG: hypothetical protein ABIG84_00750 [archaeon]